MPDLPPTEQRNPHSHRMHEMSAADLIALMHREDSAVTDALQAVTPLLAIAATEVSRTFLAGRRTVLLGAGTSGRLAAQEVAELPPTFGVPRQAFTALTASAEPGARVEATTEDDRAAAVDALGVLGVGAGDAVIGIAASGSTPFVVEGLRQAHDSGAWTCGIANNPDTPLMRIPRLAILLDTGPEVLTGSTRLKAGTAQKIALNRITTAAMALAGRIRENHMIDLTGSNEKLQQRALRIVADLAGLPSDQASAALQAAGWSVRAALETLEDRQ